MPEFDYVSGSLEDRLKELQSLEVGSVERVIGDIERTKVETEKVQGELEQELQAYAELVGDKLPKIINNIALLAGYIKEFKDGLEITRYGNFNTAPLTNRVGLEGGSVRLVRGFQDSWNCGNFNLVFDSDGKIFKIFLAKYEYERSRKVRMFSRKRQTFFDSVKTLVSQTPEEFTLAYLELVTPQLKNDGNSPYTSLPTELAKVPKEIVDLYNKIQEKEKKKVDTVKSESGIILGLDTSDFK